MVIASSRQGSENRSGFDGYDSMAGEKCGPMLFYFMDVLMRVSFMPESGAS